MPNEEATKVCPLYKQAWVHVWGKSLDVIFSDDGCSKVFSRLVACDRGNCAMWVPSFVDPENSGHCGLKKM